MNGTEVQNGTVGFNLASHGAPKLVVVALVISVAKEPRLWEPNAVLLVGRRRENKNNPNASARTH